MRHQSWTVIMRWAAGVATLTVSMLILARFLDAPDSIILALFLPAVVVMGALLVHGFILTRKIVKSETGLNRFYVRAHIVAHIIPLSYMITQYLGYTTFALNLAYLLPLIFFYYTGRRLWKILFTRFGTKMYLFFVFGNTGMMTGIIMLTVLGLIFPARFGPAPFSWAVLGYFAVHFLLTGIAIMQIERDLNRQSGLPVPAEEQVYGAND